MSFFNRYVRRGDRAVQDAGCPYTCLRMVRPTRCLNAPRFACRIEAHPEFNRARFA